ncbi:MAG: hypothetical protein IKD32_02070 [Bacteroidales bacterium]|nr:hypothetical protein [Bacteroidales bacterium]
MKNDRYIPYEDVIYRLDGYVIYDIDEASYPVFDVYHNEEIMFHTLEEAERKIEELANEKSENRYCFFVREVPLGVHCYHSQSQRIRSYTRDGKLFAESAASGIEDTNGVLEMFKGRDEDELQFRSGDLVEVFRGDCVTLEIVCSLPIDRTEVIKRILSSNRRLLLDCTDDSFVTLDGDEGYMECHSHPAIVQCFPADTLKMNEDFKKKLLNGYQKILHNE